jgi:hypothetical protein
VTFDPDQHRRGGGGRFADQPHDEATGVSLDAPVERIEIKASPFRSSWMPGTEIVELSDPPPFPRIGSDWTDPTRDQSAGADIDSRSASSERNLSVRAVISAVDANLDSRLSADRRVPTAAVVETEAWVHWAGERFDATGDTYYDEFRSGIRAGRIALMAGPLAEADGSDPESVEEAVSAWENDAELDEATANRAWSAMANDPVGPQGAQSWGRTASLTCGGVTSGDQDGVLMVGRIVAGIGRPTPI